MTLSHPDLLYVASGLFVGLLVGQTGVGGGSLMTPLLVLLFGIHPATAVGTDLLYASVTKTVGSAVHGANHTVDWRLVRRLAAGSLPACAVTLLILSRVNPMGAHASELLSLTLGIVLVGTAISIMLRPQVIALLAPRLEKLSPRRIALLTTLTGAIVGVLVSITSIGAGAIAVTAMFALYPHLPARTLVGSDIVHAVPLTLLAGVGHLIMGSVNAHLLAVLLCGSIPGVLIGSFLAAIVPDIVTRPLLATVLAIVGLRLVM
jgi:uncharacterized membrane protein YfcA